MAIETPSDEGICPKVILCLECCSEENGCHLHCEVQHWKSSATAFHPAPQNYPTQNLCVYLVKVAVLPASVLANPEAQLG